MSINEEGALINGGRYITPWEITVENYFNLPHDKIVFLDTGDLYKPTETGLQNALDDASDANVEQTVLLPATKMDTDPIEVNSTIVRDKRVSIFGRGMRTTALHGTTELGSDPVIKDTGDTSCRGIYHLSIEKEGSGPTHLLSATRMSRLRAGWYETYHLKIDMSNIAIVNLTRCHIGFYEQAVEGPGLEAVQSEFGLIYPYPDNVMILRDGTDNTQPHVIIGSKFGQSLKDQIIFKGINTGKGIFANNYFMGIRRDSPDNTYNAITLQDDAGGDPTEDILFRGNTFLIGGSSTYKNCFRLEGGTDYCMIIENNGRGAYGTSSISKTDTQNANGIEGNNLF